MSYICVGFNGTLLINLATVCTVEKGYSHDIGFTPDSGQEAEPGATAAVLLTFIGGSSRIMGFESQADRDRIFDSLQPRRTGVVLPG